VSKPPLPPGAPGAPGAPPQQQPDPGQTSTTPSPPPVPFRPFAVEAEKGALGGGARTWSCGTCSGGVKVRSIGNNSGSVTVTVPGVPAAGTYQMTVTYELGEASRTFYIGVNNGAGTPVTFTSNITDWNTPLSATVPVTLAAGNNTIKLYNPTTFAPDLDKVAVK
jgi:hypothetical protein